jgi:hypothetical protein
MSLCGRGHDQENLDGRALNELRRGNLNPVAGTDSRRQVQSGLWF